MCRLRAWSQCTTAKRGRRIGRHPNEEDIDRVRGYHATELYAKAMRKRQVWVEPLFAEAKAWHGLRRFRLRRLEQVNGEALLIAAGQNLKRLLSHWGWGATPIPQRVGWRRPAGSPTPASPCSMTDVLSAARCPRSRGIALPIPFFTTLGRF